MNREKLIERQEKIQVRSVRRIDRFWDQEHSFYGISNGGLLRLFIRSAHYLVPFYAVIRRSEKSDFFLKLVRSLLKWTTLRYHVNKMLLVQAMNKESEELVEGAGDFASMAEELAKKIENKPWYKL